ncbi:MAG: YidC/Oxa1 family insertase periplasmic-domain containing protein, partial [Muribaculaceae bacterium]|nr:YidC/Oxa1 family insertase periplasmic-domain containing protein [Muribaculaceae bacterium]
MDKNTLTGLVLMAAVMFGFFWLTKPSEEEINAQRQKQEQAEKALREAQQQQAATISFSPSDSISLINAVKAMGTPDAGGRTVFSNSQLRLSVDSVSGLSGTFVDGDTSVDINDLLSGRAVLASAGATRATKAVRSAIDNALRYEGFARYLSGEGKEYVLENDLVKVTLDTRGARVSKVELKKFKTELTDEPSNIMLFRDD